MTNHNGKGRKTGQNLVGPKGGLGSSISPNAITAATPICKNFKSATTSNGTNTKIPDRDFFVQLGRCGYARLGADPSSLFWNLGVRVVRIEHLLHLDWVHSREACKCKRETKCKRQSVNSEVITI